MTESLKVSPETLCRGGRRRVQDGFFFYGCSDCARFGALAAIWNVFFLDLERIRGSWREAGGAPISQQNRHSAMMLFEMQIVWGRLLKY